MARFPVLLACASAFLLGACVGDSALPTATGKSGIRAINAIKASPDIDFRIQELTIGTIVYKRMSVMQQFDDLIFTLNFDVHFTGDSENTRIASREIDFVAEQDYTLLISGTVANPTLTLWEATQRTFAAEATVFQVTFAHASNLLGLVDYYFAAPGMAPVSGEAVATLSFAETLQPADFEAGEYVINITAAGDPGSVLYTSAPIAFAAQTNFTILPFDGDANDIAPVVVRALAAQGTAATMADIAYPATVEFMHASLDLGVSDVYDDENLSSRILANHTFQELSAAVPVLDVNNTFRYTPAGDTAMVTVEGSMLAFPGIRYRFVAGGESGAYLTTAMVPDRRPIDTAAKILLFQTSNNFDFLDIYAVAAGATIDEATPFRTALTTGLPSAPGVLTAGSYDIYVTALGETAILAGPVRIDVALGDVVDMAIFDTVDPAVLDIVLLP